MRWTITLIILFVFSCKKKDNPAPAAPIVLTVGVTDITDSSFKVGGKVSNFDETLSTTGFCWSTLTSEPSVSDDTSVIISAAGAFAQQIKNIDPSTTYYVRAYAINSLGTGYGDVFSVNTLNAVPKILDVTVTGTAVVDSTLTSTYLFSDFENDPDSGSVYQWYASLDTSASGNEIPIPGANLAQYKVVLADTTAYLRVGVTPFSSSGASPGGVIKSIWVGPVPRVN
jgi:hypothetical protein